MSYLEHHTNAILISQNRERSVLPSQSCESSTLISQNEPPNFAVLTLPFYDYDCVTVRRRSYVKFCR